MNLRQALIDARKYLENAGIEDASLEAEVLLRYVSGMDRNIFFAALEESISPDILKALNDVLERRTNGEPSAYITGHREFFGLDFLVDRRVLIPRPETELLVEKAISLCHTYGYQTVADIGTGSGAIAISLAVHLTEMDIIATDKSDEALDVARKNAVRHGVTERIRFISGDLLEALPGPVDLICANLPYVTGLDLQTSRQLDYEPRSALDGGPDGLDALERICRQAPGYLNQGGSMVLETGMGQTNSVKTTLFEIFPEADIRINNDLADIDRLVTIRLTPPQL